MEKQPAYEVQIKRYKRRSTARRVQQAGYQCLNGTSQFQLCGLNGAARGRCECMRGSSSVLWDGSYRLIDQCVLSGRLPVHVELLSACE